MSDEMISETGIVVRRKNSTKKRKRTAPVLNKAYAERLMDAADGAEGTDSEWQHSTKLDKIDKMQREGVDAKGNATRIYIHFNGVDTADIDTGEIIPRPQ